MTSAKHATTIVVFVLIFVSVGTAGPTLSRVNGLGVTSRGGIGTGGTLDTFTALVTPGSGRFDINSVSTGPMMKTAGWSAYHYAQSAVASIGCKVNFDDVNINIELDEKLIAHEGPSAAAGMALAILAALSERPVRPDMAITGDVSQLGEVLPVGAIPAKVTAAYRAGMRTVIVPYANINDLPALSDTTLLDFQVITANHMTQVLFHGWGINYPGGGYGEYADARSKALQSYRDGAWKECEPALDALVRDHPEDYSLRRLLMLGKARLVVDKEAIRETVNGGAKGRQ